MFKGVDLQRMNKRVRKLNSEKTKNQTHHRILMTNRLNKSRKLVETVSRLGYNY